MSRDGFLDRWSRRKRSADTPPLVEPAASDAPPEAVGENEPPDITPEEIAALPQPEAMTAETHLGQFLRRGVPRVLRQTALRRMWQLNPAIRDYVDDAREYAQDWNAPGGGPGGGMVSREQAASLLARVFGPAIGAPEAIDAAAEGLAEPATAAAPQVDPVPREPPYAAPRPVGDTLPVLPANQPAASGPPRRRHGGAAPV